MEVSSESVAQCRGPGLRGYGVEEGGVENGRVGLCIGWIRLECTECGFKRRRSLLWWFCSCFILQFDGADFRCFECCGVARVWERICLVCGAGWTSTGEEISISEFGLAELGGVCGIDVGDREFCICGDSG